MRFLADESCDFGVVRALRDAGHDVVAVAEISPRADDEAVADLALRDDRILFTEDKDFGRLAFATTRTAGGVILIRFPGDARRLLGPTVVDAVAQHGGRLAGSFVVVSPGRIRITETP